MLNAPSLEALPSSCTQYLSLLRAWLCRGTAHFIPVAAVLPSAAPPASALPVNCLFFFSPSEAFQSLNCFSQQHAQMRAAVRISWGSGPG